MDSSASTDDFVVVGRIGPAHGLKGEVFVEPRTDEPERRFATGQRLQAVDRDADGGELRAPTPGGWSCASRRSPTATPPRRPAAPS